MTRFGSGLTEQLDACASSQRLLRVVRQTSSIKFMFTFTFTVRIERHADRMKTTGKVTVTSVLDREGACHLSCGVDWAGCVHSALQRGGKGGETAAGRPTNGMVGTNCPESGGSSPE